MRIIPLLVLVAAIGCKTKEVPHPEGRMDTVKMTFAKPPTLRGALVTKPHPDSLKIKDSSDDHSNIY
jgi:hypothetical protein